MTGPTVSIVIVSRDRPEALRRCLVGVEQLVYPTVEVVVVADKSSLGAVHGLGWQDRVKIVPFDTANISAARNAGIVAAAGQIVAFLDDDAVPEPTWLRHLTGPFGNPDVAAAGGYVIGRNGISFQWTAATVGIDGHRQPLEVDTVQSSLHIGAPKRAIKTEGTNMAVRRDVLVQLGGFDEAYRFYLDETDLNMRIARFGGMTAIVPLAQVHHGFAASARRRPDRTPRDLTEIAASMAIFRRKFDPDADMSRAHRFERAAQRRRLLGMMVDGRLGPGDVGRLLKGFDRGWQSGLQRDFGQTAAFLDTPPPYHSFLTERSGFSHLVVTGRFWQKRSSRAVARSAVAQGHHVSMILLSFSARYHRVRFLSEGFWEQSGGQFGKSDRADPMVRFWRARARFDRETQRVGSVRTIPEDKN